MKRIFAFVLAVCMLLPLVGCGGTTETTTETTAETGSGNVVQDVMDGIHAATAIAEGEEYDFESHLPLVKEGEDNKLTIGLVTSASTTDYYDNDFTHWAEEVTGIEFDFVQFPGSASDAATQLSLMMAAGEKLPDIILRFTKITQTQGAEFGKDGYFLDLSPYFQNPELNYYRKWKMEMLKPYFDETTYDDLQLRQIDTETGAMYAYPYLSNAPEDRPKFHVSINKVWLETVGMEAPTDVESLRAVLEAFRDNDPNGNGIKDEMPMVGRNTASYTGLIPWLVNAFVFWHNTYHFNVTDGKLWTPYNTDEYRQALIYINDLKNDGLITEQVWTMDTTELKSLQNPEDGVYKVGVIPANRYATISTDGTAMQDFVELRPLADATGKGGYGPLTNYLMEYNTFITADCENPELAFKFLDFFCSPECAVRNRWGKFEQDWTFSDGTKLGNLGGTAMYKCLTDDPQTYPNNITWHNYAGLDSVLFSQKEVDISDPNAYTTARYYRDLDSIRYHEEAGQPEEVYYFGIFEGDESVENDDLTADLDAYIDKSRDEFCAGIMDPRDDAQWQKYLDNLDSLDYDRWVELNQIAYDRYKSVS